MAIRILAISSCLVALALAQRFPGQTLNENDVCMRFNYREWYCRKAAECPQVSDGAGRGGPLGPCGLSPRGEPLVCCPPSPATPAPRSASIKMSKANHYCERYLEICEDDFNGLGGSSPDPGPAGYGGWGGPPQYGPQDYWPGGHYRWKRQASPQGYRSHGLLPSIVGGRVTAPTERPYMALIGYGEERSKEWNCGGSLLSERFVLSAAHCAETRELGLARWVRLGETDMGDPIDDGGIQDFVIVKRFIHPDYKKPAIYHDIALFKIRRGAIFNGWARPVCLHTSTRIPATKAIATGWGRTDFVGDTSPQLREVEISLVENQECKRLLGVSNGTRLPNGINMDIMLCAGEKRGGKDTCSGDSGGPLIIQELGKCLMTQVGITSFGRECGKANSPGVYTRVSYYVPWIESIVWP